MKLNKIIDIINTSNDMWLPGASFKEMKYYIKLEKLTELNKNAYRLHFRFIFIDINTYIYIG